MPHVTSEFKLGNVQLITLRQPSDGSELSWVSFVDQPTATDVVINAVGVAAGDYSITLETFDRANRSRLTTLMSDTLTIKVFGFVRTNGFTDRQVSKDSGTDTSYIDHIEQSPASATVFEIEMRQDSASTLSWVTLTREATKTKIDINPASQSTGTYTLTLESFDRTSSSKPTLQTDTM